MLDRTIVAGTSDAVVTVTVALSRLAAMTGAESPSALVENDTVPVVPAVVTVTGIENVVGVMTVTLYVPLMSGVEFDPLIVTGFPLTRPCGVLVVMTVAAATVLAVIVETKVVPSLGAVEKTTPGAGSV